MTNITTFDFLADPNDTQAAAFNAARRALLETYFPSETSNDRGVWNTRFSSLLPPAQELNALTRTPDQRIAMNLLNSPSAAINAIARAQSTAALVFLARPDLTRVNADGTGGEVLPGGVIGQVRSIEGVTLATQTGLSRPRFARRPVSGIRNRARFAGNTQNNTGWIGSITFNGVTATFVQVGVDPDGEVFRDYDIAGTASANTIFGLHNFTDTRAPAASGQTWTASWAAQVLSGNAGADASTGFRLDVRGETAPATETETTGGPVVKPTSMTSYTTSRTLNNAATNQARADFNFRVQSGDTVDCRVRVKGLQFEQGASRTAWQRTESLLDITEAGVRSAWGFAPDGVAQTFALATPFQPAAAYTAIAIFDRLAVTGDRVFAGNSAGGGARLSVSETGFASRANSVSNQIEAANTTLGPIAVAARHTAGASNVFVNGTPITTTVTGAAIPMAAAGINRLFSDGAAFAAPVFCSAIILAPVAMTDQSIQAIARAGRALTGVPA